MIAMQRAYILFLLGSMIAMGLAYFLVDSTLTEPLLFGRLYAHHIPEIAMFAGVGFQYGYGLHVPMKRITPTQLTILSNISVLITAPLLGYLAVITIPHTTTITILDIFVGAFEIAYAPFFGMEVFGYLLKHRKHREVVMR